MSVFCARVSCSMCNCVRLFWQTYNAGAGPVRLFSPGAAAADTCTNPLLLVLQAPCKTNVFLNYWIGTLCLPETPFDVKPEEEEADAGRRRRKYLFF